MTGVGQGLGSISEKSSNGTKGNEGKEVDDIVWLLSMPLQNTFLSLTSLGISV